VAVVGGARGGELKEKEVDYNLFFDF